MPWPSRDDAAPVKTAGVYGLHDWGEGKAEYSIFHISTRPFTPAPLRVSHALVFHTAHLHTHVRVPSPSPSVSVLARGWFSFLARVDLRRVFETENSAHDTHTGVISDADGGGGGTEEDEGDGDTARVGRLYCVVGEDMKDNARESTNLAPITL